MKWKKPILSLGVEVKCGTTLSYAQLYKLFNTNNFYVDVDTSIIVLGENIIYNTFEIKYHSQDKESMYNFLKKLRVYIRQNSTCDNHVHLRIEKEFLPIFTSFKFYKYFIRQYIQKYKNIKKYITRLNNKYCKKIEEKYTLISQLHPEGNPKAKYHAINLRSLFKNLTIEIRVMPHAENFDEHWEQINFIEETIHEFLNKSKNCILYRDKLKINQIDIVEYMSNKLGG